MNTTPVVTTSPLVTKKKHPFLKFLLILALIIIIPLVIYKVINFILLRKMATGASNTSKITEQSNQTPTNIELAPDSYKLITAENYEWNDLSSLPATWQTTDSDGDGISNQDEIARGSAYDETDSDGDGLFDDEEITTFHSNPAKFSSSNDGISDMTKIMRGLDPNTALSETEKTATQIKQLSNLISVKPANIMAESEMVYRRYQGTTLNELQPLIEPFILDSFSGQITLDVSAHSDLQLQPYYYNYHTKEIIPVADYTLENNQLSWQIDHDFPYTIAPIGTINSAINSLQNPITANNNQNEQRNLYAFTINIPFLSHFVRLPFYIYEENYLALLSGKETDANLQTTLQTELPNYEVKHFYVQPLASMFIKKVLNQGSARVDQLTSNNNTGISLYNEQNRRKSLIIFHPFNTTSALLSFINEDNATKTLPEPVITIPAKTVVETTTMPLDADSGFSLTRDGWSFENIGSDVSPGGVCAGYAYITDAKYSHHRNLEYYYFEENAEKYFADTYLDNLLLGETNENNRKSYALIYDHNYPYDFKFSTEIAKPYFDNINNSEQGISSQDLSASQIIQSVNNDDYVGRADAFLIAILNFYWYAYNHQIPFSFKIDFGGQTSWQRIETIHDKFAAGQIVSLSFIGGGSGHAVNAYKMVQNPNDPDEIIISVYDNNFPNNKATLGYNDDGSKKIVDVLPEILIRRHYRNTFWGEEVTFTFSYYLKNPASGACYHYGYSNDGQNNWLGFYEPSEFSKNCGHEKRGRVVFTSMNAADGTLQIIK